MLSTTKVRTILITLVAATSFASASLAPVAAHADTVKQKDLKEKDYTCEHTSDNLTICENKEGHEYWCEESTDECSKMKLEVGKETKIYAPIVKATGSLVMAQPPVTTKPSPVTLSVTKILAVH